MGVVSCFVCGCTDKRHEKNCCCMYVNEAGGIETDLKNIWEKTKILQKVVQDDTLWGF